MEKKRKKIYEYITGGLIVLLLPLWVSALDKAAPAFSARDIEGKMVSSKDIYAKGPSIVFFGMTCSCCEVKKDQIDALKKLYETYNGKGFEIVAVFSDGQSKAAQIKKIIKVNKLPFRSIIDNSDHLKNLFKPIELPTIYIITGDGRIVSRYRGYQKGDVEKMEQEVANLFQ